MTNPKTGKKRENLAQQLGETIIDLQRTRADFENYRKNSELAIERKANVVKNTTLMKMIPIVDDIERATAYLPADLTENEWAKGVVALREKLLKDLNDLGVQKINATAGMIFNPDYHEAVQMDDEGGEQELIAEELRSGWAINGEVTRPSMVKVVKK
jgi:Molecular chaperone GrpE (heat shock protein)